MQRDLSSLESAIEGRCRLRLPFRDDWWRTTKQWRTSYQSGIQVIKSQVKVQVTARDVTRHFMVEEDWVKIKLNEPQKKRAEISTVESAAVGRACKLCWRPSPWPPITLSVPLSHHIFMISSTKRFLSTCKTSSGVFLEFWFFMRVLICTRKVEKQKNVVSGWLDLICEPSLWRSCTSSMSIPMQGKG